MIKKIFIFSLVFANIFALAQIPVTAIHTDYNNYWTSSSSAINSIRPDNSHNLLAFTWKNVTYSTGVNDSQLDNKGVNYQAATFSAFPTYDTPNSVAKDTYIGVGINYGGAGDVSPIPVNDNLASYLSDGINGLNLGTGIFNFPVAKNITYDITSINPASINDGLPDVIITQTGVINNVLDEFYFTDAAGNVVGQKYIVDFGTIDEVGESDWKFYNISSPPTYNARVSRIPARKLRLLAFDWSELGLTQNNITSVTQLVQVFSGKSDLAFTAFNRASIDVKVSVSGKVFNDNDGDIPNGNGYVGATLNLNNDLDATVATTTTTMGGNYAFPNVSAGSYIIELETPNGFVVVGNSANNTQNTLSTVVSGSNVTGINFGINEPPIAYDDTLVGEMNTSATLDITSNDVDPNNGSVIPETIDLIVPAGASNIITSNNYTKGFTVPGQGTWSVDNAGIITFTPITGFTGDVTPINYTIKDMASLISNEAVIYMNVNDYCYRPANKTGTELATNQGITTLGRAGDASQWPTVRKGGWIALESNTTGFVVNRIPKTSQLAAINSPVEGMMVYDQQENCLKIYTTTDKGVTYGWKCIKKQTCPTN